MSQTFHDVAITLPDGVYRVRRASMTTSYSWVFRIAGGRPGRCANEHADCYTSMPWDWEDWSPADFKQAEVGAFENAGWRAENRRDDNYYR